MRQSARLGFDFALQAGLQPQHGLGVQLRDARLGDAEDLSDLSEGQVLVVVERDHQLLALGQARDRVREAVLQLADAQLLAPGRPRSGPSSCRAGTPGRRSSRRRSTARRARPPSSWRSGAGSPGSRPPRSRASPRPPGRSARGPSSCSSLVWVASISRAFARTERGTQSSERSSSMIEPLMRATANVSNLISRLRSKRSIAPIRPEQAVRDQVGLLDVRGQAARHAARRRTSRAASTRARAVSRAFSSPSFL